MTRESAHRGVLVGVDGSSASKVAVAWAARTAAMHEVPLTLIHVICTRDAGAGHDLT
jgi:nucleotide-binding universal stress UspA family protein